VSRGSLIVLGSVLSAGVALALALRLRRLPAPRALNHRGQSLPLVLGIALAAGLTVGVSVVLAVDAGQHVVFPATRGAAEIFAAILLVFAAGLLDDLQPHTVHGVVRHFAELLRGRVTSGIVKMAMAVVAAAVFCWVARDHDVPLYVGVPFVAGMANLWNLLDVAPGRAVKAFLPIAVVPLVLAHSRGFALFDAAALGGAVVILALDLAEVGMLGDSGAYLLGFVGGAGLFLRLSTLGVVVGLALVVLLHVMAETVTLTRLIRATPPLRWLDDLGRLREGDLPAESSASA